MIVFMSMLSIIPVPVRFEHACIWETHQPWRSIQYGVEIPANFHFYGPEKAIKLAEK